MSTEILIPKLGFNSEDGKISEWLVADGTEVKEGQMIFSLESDKAVVEIEAPASGRLTILGTAGESYAIGTVIGRVD